MSALRGGFRPAPEAAWRKLLLFAHAVVEAGYLAIMGRLERKTVYPGLDCVGLVGENFAGGILQTVVPIEKNV